MPPSFLLLLIPLLPTASPQFIYPPNVPSDKTLSDYTSGNTSPLTNFVIHDGLWGSYITPKPAFSITRCAQAGRTEPIYPSNSTFNSTVGQFAEDGTWQWMDSYSNGDFANVYSAGNNPWPIFDFAPFVGNETTGHVCWWELYSVKEKQDQSWTWDANNTGTQNLRREVTLVGSDTANYFASTPFVVQTTMRAGNRNVTWRSSGQTDNSASKTTISISNRPTNAAAHGHGVGEERLFTIGSLFGILVGLVV